jgi:hypothetical protein
MRGNQLPRQWQVIRAIKASRKFSDIIGLIKNSSDAKKYKHLGFPPLFLLPPHAISKMLPECIWGGFYPPFLKGGRGGFLIQATAEIHPYPPFPKGGFSAILRLTPLIS